MWNYFDTMEVCKIPKVLGRESLGKKVHKALDHDNIVICDNNIYTKQYIVLLMVLRINKEVSTWEF